MCSICVPLPNNKPVSVLTPERSLGLQMHTANPPLKARDVQPMALASEDGDRGLGRREHRVSHGHAIAALPQQAITGHLSHTQERDPVAPPFRHPANGTRTSTTNRKHLLVVRRVDNHQER